jgi:hypothetical protein
VIYCKLTKPDHNVMLQPTENNTNQKKKEKVMGELVELHALANATKDRSDGRD